MARYSAISSAALRCRPSITEPTKRRQNELAGFVLAAVPRDFAGMSRDEENTWDVMVISCEESSDPQAFLDASLFWVAISGHGDPVVIRSDDGAGRPDTRTHRGVSYHDPARPCVTWFTVVLPASREKFARIPGGRRRQTRLTWRFGYNRDSAPRHD
jgi:hypothetical protein